MTDISPKADELKNGSHPLAEAKTPFVQVHTKRGYEYIAMQIREAIMLGKLRAGDRLPAEREMADIFGVSRQGVREAIRSLESVGLIQTRVGVHGGAFVLEGDVDTVTRAISDLVSLGTFSSRSLFEARTLLTSSVIRLACNRATEADFVLLEEDTRIVEALLAVPSPQRTAQITEFYRLLAAATHNEVLVALTDALAQIIHAALNRANLPPNPKLAEFRRSIIGHMRTGDAESAIAEISAHFQRLEELVTTTTKAGSATGSAPPAPA